MSLYDQWLKLAYNERGQSNAKLWKLYLPLEQKFYEYALDNRTERFRSTVGDFARQFDMPHAYVCGVADGIKEALDNEIEPKELDENSALEFDMNFEKLFAKMIEYKARHLYTLPQWDGVLDQETRDRLLFEQTKGKVVVREEKKVGRNDPCPCGSGKKYKLCCGA